VYRSLFPGFNIRSCASLYVIADWHRPKHYLPSALLQSTKVTIRFTPLSKLEVLETISDTSGPLRQAKNTVTEITVSPPVTKLLSCSRDSEKVKYALKYMQHNCRLLRGLRFYMQHHSTLLSFSDCVNANQTGCAIKEDDFQLPLD
jgi:hypothetical protein